MSDYRCKGLKVSYCPFIKAQIWNSHSCHNLYRYSRMLISSCRYNYFSTRGNLKDCPSWSGFLKCKIIWQQKTDTGCSHNEHRLCLYIIGKLSEFMLKKGVLPEISTEQYYKAARLIYCHCCTTKWSLYSHFVHTCERYGMSLQVSPSEVGSYEVWWFRSLSFCIFCQTAEWTCCVWVGYCLLISFGLL